MLSQNTICLWYDGTALDAARFYAATFANSAVGTIFRAPGDFPSGKEGDVLTVEFTVLGIPCLGLNGGPVFKLSEAMSLSVSCDTQEEIDYYWEKLGAGGDAACQNCGWLKDRFGLSWQIVPGILASLVSDPTTSASVMQAVLSMTKLDLQRIRDAAKSATH